MKKKGIRIDLSLIGDAEALNKKLLKTLPKADSAWQAYQDYLTRADKPFKEMIDARDELTGLMSDAGNVTRKLEQGAKDIGLKVSEIPAFSNVENNMRVAKEIFDTITKFKDPTTFQ